MLKGLGVASPVIRDAMLTGVPAAIDSAIKQDWNKPGQALANIALDTAGNVVFDYALGQLAFIEAAFTFWVHLARFTAT